MAERPPQTQADGALEALSDDDLLDLLFTAADLLPRRVIDELVRRADSTIPLLAEIVEEEASWCVPSPPECWAPVHATFALSATGRIEAVDPLLRAMRLAGVEGVDWVTDVAHLLFNRIGPSCFEALRAVFRDSTEATFARWQCLEAMVSLSLQREELQEVVIRDCGRLLGEGQDPVMGNAARAVLGDYHRLGRSQEVSAALTGYLAAGSKPPAWLDGDPDTTAEGPLPYLDHDLLSF